MVKTRLLWGTGTALTVLASVTGAPAQAAPVRKAPVLKPTAKAPQKALQKASQKAAPAVAAVPADLTGLTLEPASIVLDGPRSLQYLVVTGTAKDGSTHDLTGQVRFSLADAKPAKVAGGVLRPVADGKTRLTATLGKLSTAPVEVTVQNATAPVAVEFINDVMPVLAKGGCNATACHGSPVGKGGFKLSLFGYEPGEDFKAIAEDQKGKRINAKAPEQSLLLTKATMSIPHAGGVRFKTDSPEYKILLAWLKEGAPGVGEFEARVKQLRVLPGQPWMPRPEAVQRLVVVAEMTDGSVRDITQKAVYSSNDDAIADVDDRGLVTAKRPGETAVMVRYLGQVAISRIAVLPSWKLPESKLGQANYIDKLVQAKLQKLRTAPAPLCSDEEFVRRTYLDACGIIPTAEEAKAFLEDTSPDKRAKLIDQLLARPEHTDLWTLRWNDTIRNNPRLTRVGAEPFAQWIREQIASNRPYNEWVSDILTATGKTSPMQLDMANLPRQLQRQLEGANPRQKERIEAMVQDLNSRPANPPANYFVISKDPLDTTSATSQIFLGVRIECARCHNHPFEKWTQNDYYGLAAFFTGVQARGNNQTPSVVTVNFRTGNPRHPKTNEIMEPKTLDDLQVKVPKGEDKRVELAAWMTSPENPFFARSLVNRLWGHYFGRGIVEPVDDFRVTNPASNPELLDALAKDFVDHKFDLKQMHRTILNSRTYQESSVPNQYNRHDVSNFARYYPKRLMAEQLYDSISQATGVYLGGGGRAGRRPGKAARYGASEVAGGTNRVMQLPTVVAGARGGGGANAGVVQFLDTFGKPRREAVCECERSYDGNIGQALALINGDEVNDKIAAPQGRVQRLIRSTTTEAQLAEELYLAALSRRPTPEELNDATSLLRSSKTKAEGAEDLMWSLLNSREFLFNH
ncbi:MAG: Bacterial Ig-like domain (group 2) [Armatimonadetes bacterium]|jgi:hypothetical protein|nr:Bacterial Ig-like domain (group 2) [Armatimonadota bacterium]